MCSARPSRFRPAHARKVRVRHALGELAQPRLDVAAERHDLEVGAPVQHLRLPPQRRGADDRARRAARRAMPYLRLMKASRTSSRCSSGAEREAGGRTVGMSFMECTARSIAPASSASSISLVKRPLPPASAERPVGDAVAAGLDDDDLAGALREPCALVSRAHDLARLRQRQRRAARADADLASLQAVLSGC